METLRSTAKVKMAPRAMRKIEVPVANLTEFQKSCAVSGLASAFPERVAAVVLGSRLALSRRPAPR